MALVLAGCGAGSSKEDAASDAGPVSVHPPPDAGPTGLVPQTPPGVDRLTTGERGAALALDGQRLYWASQAYAANAGDDQILLRSMPRAGGAATTLANLPGVMSGASVGGSTGGVELLSADQDALYLSAVNCSRDPANSYGCSPAVSREASAVLYRVAKAGGAVTTVDPASRSLASAPPQISGTRSYLTQDPQPLLGKPGCLQITNLGGSHCIDRGMYHYGPLLLDDAGVFYLRDGDVFRAGLDAPADPVDTDGEWTESGAAVPAPQAVTPSASATVLAPAGLLNSMAIDEDNVYWTAGSDSLYAGSLQAVPKAGGAPVTLAALRGSGYDLDASTSSLIFSHFTDDGLSFSGIRRLSKQGGALEWLGRPVRTLVDGDSIVYQDTEGSLYRADLDGGNRVSLGVNQPQMSWGGFTVSNGEIFWL
ncbi:MAG TPA: hypothetical protein VH083_20595, partial [Myxococcales bacterium]|nr:hypothetical protein [Myxococcales bacterium]